MVAHETAKTDLVAHTCFCSFHHRRVSFSVTGGRVYESGGVIKGFCKKKVYRHLSVRGMCIEPQMPSSVTHRQVAGSSSWCPPGRSHRCRSPKSCAPTATLALRHSPIMGSPPRFDGRRVRRKKRLSRYLYLIPDTSLSRATPEWFHVKPCSLLKIWFPSV